jgi:DNA-binding transcriptional LysR family regulator
MLTLRQIEVIRAIMVTGTVGGAARLLNVSSPGVSRVMKHAETSVGVKLFSRRGGRYSPTPQANAIFNQINGVYDKVEDLQFVISRIKRGANTELKIGSVPSIANVMVPRAIADLRKALPNLLIEVDILKIEDAIDYLLLGKGELVALSCKLDHSLLAIEPLARGRLKCIVPDGHPLARRARVTADEIVKYPLIGVDPNDPYGRIMAGLFASHDLHYEVTIRARFGSTVCALSRTVSALPLLTSSPWLPTSGRDCEQSILPNRPCSRLISRTARMSRCRATRRVLSRPCAAKWKR